LLGRGVARGEEGAAARSLHGAGAPRGAEIQENGRTVLPQVDVCRLDVAMDEPLRVQRGQSIQQRQGQAENLRLLEGFAPPEHAFQAFALLVLHDEIGRAVFFEKGQHAHDVRVLESGQGPGLVEKQTPPLLEATGQLRGTQADAAVRVAGRALQRQVFLDGHQVVQFNVACQIGNPEAALP